MAGSALSRIPPLSQAAQQFAVNRPGQFEGVRQSLYDFQIYPTAGVTQLTFFAVPRGQGQSSHTGYAAAGTVKSLVDTNMEQAGTLPNPKSFLVESIEVFFEPGSVSTASLFTTQVVYSFIAVPTAGVPAAAGAMNDVEIMRRSGYVEFFVGSKVYLGEAPIGRFPPKTQLTLDAALASNSATTATVGAASAKMTGRPYFLNPPVFLAPTQNFNVTINFPVVIATPSGFNARIGVVLDGFLYRQSQ
jgi:hypothetical protein